MYFSKGGAVVLGNAIFGPVLLLSFSLSQQQRGCYICVHVCVATGIYIYLPNEGFSEYIGIHLQLELS